MPLPADRWVFGTGDQGRSYVVHLAAPRFAAWITRADAIDVAHPDLDLIPDGAGQTLTLHAEDLEIVAVQWFDPAPDRQEEMAALLSEAMDATLGVLERERTSASLVDEPGVQQEVTFRLASVPDGPCLDEAEDEGVQAEIRWRRVGG